MAHMKPLHLILVLVLIGGCSTGGARSGDGGVRDGGSRVCTDSTDSDHDGVADEFEGAPGVDTDGDGMPDIGDTDDDGDGISTGAETGANPCAPFDNDGDGVFDFADTDSDNDGVSDADELAAGTDPVVRDTDGDGVTDLGERAAGTDPRDATSTIPPGDFFVVLPFMGVHEARTLRFGTTLQKADIYFLVDTTGSMQPAIDNVRSSLARIASEVATRIPDVQMGVGRLEDFPFSDSSPFGATFFGAATDVPYENRQDITPDVSVVGAALGALDIGDEHDGPESQVEALYQTATGEGGDWTTTIPGGGLLGGLSRYTLPPKSCPSIPDEIGIRRGYPCFRPESLPIVVLVTDIEWHNGYADGAHWPYSMITPAPHTLPQAAEALNGIGGRYIGIAVGDTEPVAYWRMDHEAVALATGSVDETGAPLVYNALTGAVSDAILMGLETLALRTPQDVNTNTENVPGNPGDTDATMFIKSIVPVEGYSPAGVPGPMPGVTYVSKDDTTFYGVTPGCMVDFAIDFYNDIVPPPATAQIYRARIIVVGNGVARLSERQVYIIVPPDRVIILI